MLKTLPQDVEPIILDFLILPDDMKRVNCVSKAWRRALRNTGFVKEKRLLEDRAYMILEDGDSYCYLGPDLGDIWESYHKWNWPPNLMSREYHSTPLWKPGMYVDVLDKIDVWGSALVKEIVFKEKRGFLGFGRRKTIRNYRVEFLGWSEKFDETVAPDRIARFGTKCMNPRCKYDSLVGNHKRWALCKDGNEWIMKEVYLVEEKEDSKVISVHHEKHTVTRGSVEENIRIITNGSAMLIDNRVRKFRPRGRFLRF